MGEASSANISSRESTSGRSDGSLGFSMSAMGLEDSVPSSTHHAKKLRREDSLRGESAADVAALSQPGYEQQRSLIVEGFQRQVEFL